MQLNNKHGIFFCFKLLLLPLYTRTYTGIDTKDANVFLKLAGVWIPFDLFNLLCKKENLSGYWNYQVSFVKYRIFIQINTCEKSDARRLHNIQKGFHHSLSIGHSIPLVSKHGNTTEIINLVKLDVYKECAQKNCPTFRLITFITHTYIGSVSHPFQNPCAKCHCNSKIVVAVVQ